MKKYIDLVCMLFFFAIVCGTLGALSYGFGKANALPRECEVVLRHSKYKTILKATPSFRGGTMVCEVVAGGVKA